MLDWHLMFLISKTNIVLNMCFFLATTSRICIISLYLSMNKNLKLFRDLFWTTSYLIWEKKMKLSLFACLFLGGFFRPTWDFFYSFGDVTIISVKGFILHILDIHGHLAVRGFLTCPSTVARANPLQSHPRWQRWHQKMAEICHHRSDIFYR